MVDASVYYEAIYDTKAPIVIDKNGYTVDFILIKIHENKEKKAEVPYSYTIPDDESFIYERIIRGLVHAQTSPEPLRREETAMLLGGIESNAQLRHKTKRIKMNKLCTHIAWIFP